MTQWRTRVGQSRFLKSFHPKAKSGTAHLGKYLLLFFLSSSSCFVMCVPGTTTHCRSTPTQVYVMRITCPTSSSSAVWQAWPCIMANCSMVSATWMCACENSPINIVQTFSKGRNNSSEKVKGIRTNGVIFLLIWNICLCSFKLSSFGLSTRWCCRSRSFSRTWSLLWVWLYFCK